jgi:hypothetical protein
MASVSPAFSADGLIIGGTEEGRPDQTLSFFGFIQPTMDFMLGAPVSGLESAGLQSHNGDRALFNLAHGGPVALTVFRARIGLRGSAANTHRKVNYFLLFEAGENALTRTQRFVPTDLSVTFSYVPGLRVRVGHFKLPVMEEIVQPVAVSHEFIYFSKTLKTLLMENPIKDGRYSGGAHGFRDTGVQLFDSFQKGSVAGAYALMLSSGHRPVGTAGHKGDVTLRGELALVTGGRLHQARRKEIKVGGWHLYGQRRIHEKDVGRMRQGVFLHVEQGVAWALMELARGEGALETGPTPPFAGGAPKHDRDGRGSGVVIQAGGRLKLRSGNGELGLKARFEHFEQQSQKPESQRIYRAATLGAQWSPSKKLRFGLNYQWRALKAPHGSDDVKTIVGSIGPRVAFEALLRF